MLRKINFYRKVVELLLSQALLDVNASVVAAAIRNVSQMNLTVKYIQNSELITFLGGKYSSKFVYSSWEK